MADLTGDSEKPGGGYTAVVYFHGIGEQRRYEETSRLVDSLDRYLAGCFLRNEPQGMLMGIRPKLRPGLADPSEVFTHIVTYYSPDRDADWKTASEVRFHEVYWAPIMAGERSTIGVVKWLGRQLIRPVGTVTSPWRERQRLRRAALAAIYENRGSWPDGTEERDFSKLAQRYDDFESPIALRDYRGGTFKEFVEYLGIRSAKRPETAARHVRLAEAWRRAYLAEEIRNGFSLASLALTITLLAGGTVALLLVLLQRLTALADGTALAQLASIAPPTLTTAVSLAGVLVGLLGIGGFLTKYVGDVEAWSTYEETDEKFEKRAKVIDLATRTFTQVLNDEKCSRVVVVAHSLGTTIAHDTMLSMVRSNKARYAQDPIKGPLPLTKIDMFVTMGSPIDKIEYFFESYRSPFHRYRRIKEELRGDIGTPPFSRSRKPFVHWINFWDDADLISGALHSPAGKDGFRQRVDNVHVASLAFPSPAASHSAYFFNRDVISRLFEIIYRRAGSFRDLPRRVKKDPDWGSAFMGPAIDPPGRRRIWTVLTAALPWTATAGFTIGLVAPDDAILGWLPTGFVALTVLAGWLLIGRGVRRKGLDDPQVVTTVVGPSEALGREASSLEPAPTDDDDDDEDAV